MKPADLSWISILRLGLVQTALGSVVVLMTSTINRVMVVELALPALVPGLMVAAHYGVQILRPAWGYRSDVGRRRTPWILFGMAALALGGVGAALGTALAARSPALGIALAAASFLAVGIGAGAAGTCVLAMLAAQVAPARRAGAATTVWVMMILGFALTAPLAGHFLDPFSPTRLVVVTATVCALAFALALAAVWRLESSPLHEATPSPLRASFAATLRQVWSEPAARRFTIFIFVSMLAYSAQELLVEPFAGLVFKMTPGVTTKLAGLQHAGVLIGMVFVAVAASRASGRASLRLWTVTGCLASAASLVAIAFSGQFAAHPAALRGATFALGLSNGVFAVAAIGSMMGLAGSGAGAREGTRMGLWGAAQALAFGLGGVIGTGLVDLARTLSAPPLTAYSLVFVAEAAAFVVAAALASRVGRELTVETPRARGAAPSLAA